KERRKSQPVSQPTPESRLLELLEEPAAMLQQALGGVAYSDTELRCIGEVLRTVAQKLSGEYPFPSPLYAGQMLQPPHPVARLAYFLGTMVNPNNHAFDGGKASSILEKEAVAELARMFGWAEHLGHLCGGGTMANLEAIWVAREKIRE